MNSKSHSEETFTNISFGSNDLAYQLFEDCVFHGCRLLEASLLSCRFVDCRFESCDLSLAKLGNATFRSTSFVECKGVGVHWASAKGVSGLSFKQCKLDSSSFENMDLRHTDFSDSSLIDADFRGARLDHASLQGTMLRGALFQRTSLVKTDFTGAQEYLFDARANTLKETKMSAHEALVLLEVLGIKIQ